MANIEKRIPGIIKKLDAAREALSDLIDFENKNEILANDSRVKLTTDLREYADYLEKSTWWHKKI